ncbi:MAG: type II toxin-antitoxin system HicB family antitoxin [Chitinophagaceae bacterium]|nr:type II toxin-antitoxin system HicB family antitoxin [Chitinophagaceae bacterium]
MNELLQYKEYLASVHFNASDEVFFGKILGIDDLVSFEGSSVKELKKAFHDAVDDYIETCRQLGKEPNKTYKGSFNIRIGTELHREAAIVAAQNNISLNDLVRSCIEYALSHWEALTRAIQKQQQ